MRKNKIFINLFFILRYFHYQFAIKMICIINN